MKPKNGDSHPERYALHCALGTARGWKARVAEQEWMAQAVEREWTAQAVEREWMARAVEWQEHRSADIRVVVKSGP